MSGKKGQRSDKGTNVPKGYTRNVLDDLDGRFKPVREVKERARQIMNELGGVDQLSCQRQSLVWRFVCLEGWIQDQERRMLQGEAVDEARWLMALNSFTGLLQRIGLERKARQISPLERLRQQSSAGPALPSSVQGIAQPGLNATEEPLTIEVAVAPAN